MKGIFITGTDTGVGKTVIAGCLARYLAEKGYRVITQKWIQTGCKSFSSSDIKMHLKITGESESQIKEYLGYVLPYMFKKACSPHLAAKLEGKKIDINKIKASFRFLSKEFDFVIVEGIGGLLVPCNKKYLLADLVKKLNLPVVVVAANKLGAINHTLLTIESLHSRKIKVLGIIFNHLKKQDKYILEDNPKIIKEFSKERIFGTVPQAISYDKIYEKFLPLGEAILKSLSRNG